MWRALKEEAKIRGGYIYKKERGYELVFAKADSVALFEFMYNNVQTQPYLERKHEIFQKAFQALNMRA